MKNGEVFLSTSPFSNLDKTYALCAIFTDARHNWTVDVHTNCLAFVKHGCVTLIMQFTAFLDDCAVDGDSVLLEVCMVHLDHDEVLVV